MCGSTAAQDQLQQEQMQAYQQAQDLTAKQYANQQEIYAPMAAQFKSILALGPNQEGFNAPEKQALNAQAVEGTAENYQHAATAVNSKIAAQGGGNNPLESGGQVQLQEEVAQSSAQEQSKEEQQILQADYGQGYNEWLNAGSGLETIASGQNPLGYENAATNSGSAAGTTADQIAQENNSWINAAIGAVGTAASGWATGGFKAPCWIAAELWGGWSEPRTVKVRTWLTESYAKTAPGCFIVPLYARYGERLAAAIRRWPVLRTVFQPIFDRALRKASE